jgi:hypothetical protein
MGVAVDELRVEPDLVHQGGNRVLLGHPVGQGLGVDVEGLADDRRDGHPRIQGGVGVLEDDLDVPALGPHGLAGQVRDVVAVDDDRAGGRWLEAHQQSARGGFPAAALPHDRQGLALIEVEADIVDSLDGADLLLEDDPLRDRVVLDHVGGLDHADRLRRLHRPAPPVRTSTDSGGPGPPRATLVAPPLGTGWSPSGSAG